MGANFETVSPRTSDRAHTLRSARQVRYVSSAKDREINPYKSGRAKADAFMLGFTEGGEMEIPPMRAPKFSRRRA